MDIEYTKTELMELLKKTQKKSVLNKIKQVFEEDSEDWYEKMSTDELQELKIGLQQVKKKDLKAHDQVMKNFDKWH